jgi:hypothetical protein
MLYFLEYRLFGDDFGAYNRVSWVVHGINSALLYLFVVSLFRERKRERWILGFIAVRFFAGIDTTFSFGVARALTWFPAQNDSVSLLFSLLALLLLDLYLTAQAAKRSESGNASPWRIRFMPAAILLSFFFSIGSKEMGYITMPVALLLMWHRGQLLIQRAGGRVRPSGIAIGFVAFAGALWVFRRTVVPHAWGPEMWRAWIFQKLLFHWSGPFWFYGVAGIYWPLLGGIAIALITWVGLRKRRPVWQIAAVSFVAALTCAQYGNQFVGMLVHTKNTSTDGSWALIFDAGGFYSLASVITYVLAIALFWKYRRDEPGLFAAGSLALVFIPILQYGGAHYFYWPGAFLGIADAVFCACIYRWAVELRASANWTIPQYVIDRFYGKPAEAAMAKEKETVGTQA